MQVLMSVVGCTVDAQLRRFFFFFYSISNFLISVEGSLQSFYGKHSKWKLGYSYTVTAAIAAIADHSSQSVVSVCVKDREEEQAFKSLLFKIRR